MNHEEEPVALRSIFRKVRSRTSGARARGRERRRSGGNSRNNNNTYNMANVLDMDELEDMEMDTDEIEIEIGIDGPGETPKAHRFGSMDVSMPPVVQGISPNNVQVVSEIETAKRKKEGVEEELVEIKPRPRAKEKKKNAPSTTSEGALAGRIPDVERYDPNLTSNQLRVESGQLRDRNDGNRARTLVLPSVFKAKYKYTDGDASDAQECEEEIDVDIDIENGNLIECAVMDTTVALVELTRLLKREFDGSGFIAGSTTELRLKVPIPIVNDNVNVNDNTQNKIQLVVVASGKWNGGCTLAFRKSLLDRSKLHQDEFMLWIARVRCRIREIEIEIEKDQGRS